MVNKAGHAAFAWEEACPWVWIMIIGFVVFVIVLELLLLARVTKLAVM
jgi:hypothetical protein